MIRIQSTAWRVSALLSLLACAPAVSLSAATGERPASKPVTLQKAPIHQLRRYEIFENNKQAFHQRFRDHAMRIMAKYDFKIVAMWESKSAERTELIYVLEWPDVETMKDRWAKFMADQEWSDIKKQTGAAHGRMVGEIEERVLQLTDYSPRSRLTD